MDSQFVVQEDLDISLQLDYAFANGVENVCIFFEATVGHIPRNKPKSLRDELNSVVPSHRHISNLKFTRTSKLLIETADLNCAKELVNIKSLLGAPVKAYIQSDNVSSRFALHNIDSDIPLTELGTELQVVNNIKIKELRRFTTRQAGTVKPTETVLVTIFGTRLPDSVRYFYISEKIKPFYDRPRQCTKCWHFDHVLAKCSYEIVCRKCSGNHLLADCTNNEAKCGNCMGPHEATDFQCPARVKEMQILKFKADHHIPITEARRRFRQSEKKSFSSAVKSSVAPPSSVSPAPSLDSMLSDFLQKAQEALERLLQQQLAVFQQHLSLMAQQQLAAFSQVVPGGLPTPGRDQPAVTPHLVPDGLPSQAREPLPAQSSSESFSPSSLAPPNLSKRLRLSSSDSVSNENGSATTSNIHQGSNSHHDPSLPMESG